MSASDMLKSLFEYTVYIMLSLSDLLSQTFTSYALLHYWTGGGGEWFRKHGSGGTQSRADTLSAVLTDC